MYIETNCTITHAGRTFEAGGAVVTPELCIGYVGALLGDGMGCERFGPTSGYTLTDWHGKPLGTIRLTSSWRTPRSATGSRMYQAYAMVNGVRYTGRTYGKGMIFRGRRCAA